MHSYLYVRQKEKKEHHLFLLLKYILWNINEELFYMPCNCWMFCELNPHTNMCIYIYLCKYLIKFTLHIEIIQFLHCLLFSSMTLIILSPEIIYNYY